MVSRVITATMLFLQFILYSSSFVGTLKNEIPGAALELCQLKIKQFSPEILKFSTKHEDNPFTLNCYMVPRTFLFIFYAGSRGLGSNNFRNSSYKEKTAGSARVSRLSFRFLWLWLKSLQVKAEAYLKPKWASMLFCQDSELLIIFAKKTSIIDADSALKRPLRMNFQDEA